MKPIQLIKLFSEYYKKLRILIIGCIIFLTSCTSLTKTQIESVNQFATITKNFSDYPSKIMTELAEVRLIRGVCYANSLSNPILHIEALDSLYNKSVYATKISEKVDITFKIIDKYAQSLALLSSDKYQIELENKSQELGIGLDSLVSQYNRIEKSSKLPTNIGGAIGKLVVIGGSQYVKSKQAKEIKKFVPKADTLISVMTSNLLLFLESENINQLIEAEEWGVKQNYLSYLRQITKPSIEDEYIYLDLKSRMTRIKNMRLQTIVATKQLRLAHKKLLLALQKRKKLTEVVDEVQKLGNDINDLNKIWEKNK